MAVLENDVMVGPVTPAAGVTTISLDFDPTGWDQSWIEVYKNDDAAPLILGTHYNVTGAGAVGATVELTSGANGTDRYSVFLATPLSRPSDMQLRGEFKSEPFNIDMDRIWQRLQLHNTLIEHSLSFGRNSGKPNPITPIASRLLGFGTDGQPQLFTLDPVFTAEGFDVYESPAALESSTELSRGVGYLWQAGEFFYEEVASGGLLNTAGGVSLNPKPLGNGFFPVAALGVDDTGATDITSTVNAITAAGFKKLQFPPGSFKLTDANLLSQMHIRGVGFGETNETFFLTGENDKACWLADTTSGFVLNVVIEACRSYPASGVTGSRFIRQTSMQFYLGRVTMMGVQTDFSHEIAFEVWPIYWNVYGCRFGYSGANNPAGQTNQIFKCVPASYTQTNRCNLNRFYGCTFWNADGGEGAIEVAHGDGWSFHDCGFEQMQVRALDFDGVYNVSFFGICWWEGIEADECIRASLRNASTGTRTVGFEGGYVNMNSSNLRFINLGSASNAALRRVQFATVPSGCVLSNSMSRISSVFRCEVLSGAGASGFFDGAVEFFGAIFASSAEINAAEVGTLEVTGATNFKDMIQDVAIAKSGLTDNPGSPETVATITIPAQASAGGQVVQAFSADLEAHYMAVATTTTIWRANRQRLGILMFREKDGTVSAQIETSGGLDNGSTSATWSVSVSGDDVLVQVTGNPSGGSFTGGITATLTGTLHTAKTTSTFTQPTIA